MESNGNQQIKIDVPTIPTIPGLPESKRKEWRENYVRAFKQAMVDHPGDEMQQRAVATREANRIFRVGDIEDYDDAMALKEWQFLKRQEEGDKLKLVTIDGKKHSFPLPAKRAAANLAKEDEEANKKKPEEEAKAEEERKKKNA